MPDPLTDAQLQEYAALAEKAIERHEPYVARVLRELLAEVARLRAELAEAERIRDAYQRAEAKKPVYGRGDGPPLETPAREAGDA